MLADPVASVSDLADVLMDVLPLAAFLGSSELARMTAEAIAEVGLRDVPEVSVERETILQQTAFQQLGYRAAYIRAGAVRLALKIKEARRRGQALGEALSSWRVNEERFLLLHMEQAIRRQLGAERVLEAVRTYGEVVGWYAEIRPTNRPHHRSAHRSNFRPALGPPLQTGSYPGVERFCLCSVGPPISGAPEIR